MRLLRRTIGTRVWPSVVAVLALSVGRCGVGSDPDLDHGSQETQKTSETLEVHRGTFQRTVLLAGTLEASESIQISAPRTPTWQVSIRWMVEDGTSVSAGEKILELDNASFTADLEEKRLKARKDEKELQQQRAQAEAQAAEKLFAVEQRLVELDKAKLNAAIPADLIPLRKYQESQLALEKAQTGYDKAKDELSTHTQTSESELDIRRIALRQIGEEIRIAEKAIRELTIAAPRSGVVIIGDIPWEGRRLQVGDNVWPGFAIMRIPNLSEMQVVAHLSDVDDGQLAAGMVAGVELESYPELSFQGSVKDITPVAQEMSPRSLRRAFRVRIELDETNAAIMRPGMAARVEVSSETVEATLLIPRIAIDFSEDLPRARSENGEWIALELGSCNSLVCICLGGLEEGRTLLAGSPEARSQS